MFWLLFRWKEVNRCNFALRFRFCFLLDGGHTSNWLSWNLWWFFLNFLDWILMFFFFLSWNWFLKRDAAWLKVLLSWLETWLTLIAWRSREKIHFSVLGGNLWILNILYSGFGCSCNYMLMITNRCMAGTFEGKDYVLVFVSLDLKLGFSVMCSLMFIFCKFWFILFGN